LVTFRHFVGRADAAASGNSAPSTHLIGAGDRIAVVDLAGAMERECRVGRSPWGISRVNAANAAFDVA